MQLGDSRGRSARKRRGACQRPRRIHDRVAPEAPTDPTPDPAGSATVSDQPSGVSRRGFLRTTAIGTAGLLIGPQLLRSSTARASRLSRVVWAHNNEATTGWTTVNQGPVTQMVHAAVCSLTGLPSAAEAWKSLFPGITPTKKIGIKINLACGDVPTHPQVVNAIVEGLLMMDLDGSTLPPENIIVHDYDTAFLCAQTGYAVNWGGPGVQYVGSDHPSIGFDMTHTYTISYPGGSTSNHHVSKIISQYCDYLINAAVIKDHDDYAGVTLDMKNHFGSFDNISITATHYAGFNTSLPSLSMILRDQIGDKTKLFLIDGTFGLYNGGPGYTPPWHTPPNWAFNSVLVSRDIVALDKIGTVKMNVERALHSLPALNPGHIHAAALPPYNLGTDDLSQIELIELPLSSQGIAEGPAASGAVDLLAPYPNPASGSCTLSFACRGAATAELVITDATGAIVRRINAGRHGAGTHRYGWDGCDERGHRVASGTYFVRLRSGEDTLQKRVVMVH
jgi:uncharacterized protein (DUF362 family)